jgi:hypothetical protein
MRKTEEARLAIRPDRALDRGAAKLVHRLCAKAVDGRPPLFRLLQWVASFRDRPIARSRTHDIARCAQCDALCSSLIVVEAG